MDRVYAGHRGGYTNPDYTLEDHQQTGYQYNDELKQAHADTRSVPNKMFNQQFTEEEDTPFSDTHEQASWKRICLHILRLTFSIALIGFLLGIPLIITRNAAYDRSLDNAVQDRNLIFWIFVWIEATFAVAALSYVTALAFPYIFYFIAKWVNPAHRRYWRIFRPLKKPYVLIWTILFSWLWWFVCIVANENCSYARVGMTPAVGNSAQAKAQIKAQADAEPAEADPTTASASEVADDQAFFSQVALIVSNILMNCLFWAITYLILKIIIVYISVHYHYRSDYKRIEQSKSMINSLVTLYETSLTRDPLYCDRFNDQDIIIRDAVAAGRKNKKDTLKFFQKIGGASGKVVSAFGSMLGSGPKSHWLKAGSTYAVIEHALDKPASARALAQRIWLSLVPRGETALTKEHIASALTLDQKEEAEKCLKALDENENGDIRLTELEPMLVEAGKDRLNIYQNMQEIDHAINTFDWIQLMVLAAAMVFIILVGYIPFLQQLKDILGFAGLGFGVAIKSAVTDYFLGCIFIFFKHPYDIGDRVDVYNIPEVQSASCIVKRISLLYCVFERTDTGAIVQYPNSVLWQRRIENLTRSGQGSEAISFNLNVDTSFKDLEYLRDEMKAFIIDPENSRDYKSNVALRVKSLGDLDRMQVSMVITHKSNWSNDALRSARSSRLYCRILEIARRVPLCKPGGGKASLGDEAKPTYMVVVSDEEAATKRAAEKLKSLRKRHDFEIVNDTELEGEEKDAKEAELRAAEAQAYKGISSVPTSMVGRAAERPVGKPATPPKSASRGIATATQYHDQNAGHENRHRGTNRSFSSERPVYDGSYAYQGHQNALGVPQQTYDHQRRGNSNGLYDPNRGNRI